MFKHIYFILVVLVLGNLAYAQNATPSRYTDFIGLRCYASGANAGADSLNANWDDIDSTAEALNDSIAAVKADVYSVIDYAGGVIDGTVMWADMSTSAKATIVQVTGTQSIAGAKTFTDNMNTESILPVEDATYNLGSINKQWYRGYFNSLRTHQLYVINLADTSEKAEITFDGASVSFNKPVEIDTLKTSAMTALQLGSNTYTPTLASDSVLTITSTQSVVKLNPVYGNMTNVETIHMTGVTVGTIVYFYSKDATYTVVFKDNAADGNLKMAGDFTIGQYDSITFMYVKVAAEQFEWMEVARSNN